MAVRLVLAVILIGVGAIWMAQGFNLLAPLPGYPGSFMDGQLFWAGAGLVCIVAGLSLVIPLALRRR